MKWIYRFVTISIIFGAFALPFFIDNQKGEPMLSMPSIPIPGLEQGSSQGSDQSLVPSLSKKTTTAYKWQDENGNWHYGDAPPTAHEGVEVLNIRNDVNMVQGFKIPEEPEEEAEDENIKRIEKARKEMTSEDEDILTFERAQNIMTDAKLAAEAMSARNDELGKIVGER